jgi:AraC-like DNA-binding protein
MQINTDSPIKPAELKRMLAPGSRARAGSYCSDGMHVDTTWHFHDMHQLMYAFEGAIEVESARGKHLIPRQLAAWIPAGAAHRTRIHRVRSGSVFFPADMVGNAGDRVRTILVSTLMREMIRESMRWPCSESESTLGAAYFAAMAKLCAEWIERETDLVLPRSHDVRLTRALDFTLKQSDATLAAVCRHAGMSERSLRRYATLEVGMTWEDYRRRARLLRAISLLSDTDAQIGDIAAQCGFESPSAFARAFRVAMGEAPRQYRNRARDPF